MNERDRFSGRPRYDEPDMISSAYLRSNASYTDFLQKQHHGEPPRDYRGPPRYPQGHPREQEFRITDLQESLLVVRGATSRHIFFLFRHVQTLEREPGWRNEPSWRASGSQPPRAESWVERRDRIAPPPGPEAQRFIAPPEIHRHIAPPHGMPHDFPQERWRGSPASANWRNERPEEPAPQRRRFDTPDRIIERPIRESSPRRSPPRRFSISPPRTTALEPIPRPEPSTEQVKIPKTDSPVRNRILPAQEVDRSNLSIPDSSSTTSEEPEVRSSWKHGPPRPREESWTLQYKRRVEAQKEAMKRNMARSSVHDIPAGPSAEQARLSERMKDDRLGREESPPRKFFFSQNDANGSREDDRQDYRDKDKYREDQDELRKYTETKTNGRLKDGESTINPSDFVEPIEQFNDDDDWNALGELLNDQSRKRPRPADEIIPSPVKTVPAPVPKPAPSDHPYYRKESSRVEAPRPQVSFFRQELPSAKSRFGILPIPEKDRAPLWEDDPKDRPSPRPDFGRRGAFPLEFEARGPPPRPEFDRRPPPRSEYGEYLGRGNIDYTYGTPPKFGPPYTAGYGNSYNEYGYR